MEFVTNPGHSSVDQRTENSAPNAKVSADSGFLMLGSVILLVGLLGFVVTLLGIFLHLQKWKQEQHLCRQRVHQAQEHLLSGFKELMALNPQAKNLRIQRKVWEKAVRTAPDPISRSTATARLATVILKQQLFSRKQKLIITKSKSLARATLSPYLYQSSSFRIPFSLKPFPKNSPTPDYLPPLRLQKLQKIEITWTKSFKKTLLKNQCGSTITRHLQGFKIKFLFPAASFLKG